MPILGIIASSKFGDAGDFESIATATASGSSATLEFTSIPSTFQHLQIRMLTRSTRAAASSNIFIGFNSDTTTGNYYGHMLQGDGASATAAAKIGTSTSFMSATSAASNTAGIFSGVVIDVLDYKDTNKYKTSRGLSGYDANGSGLIYLASGLWMNTNAITSIQLTDALGNFASGSVAALYGIRSA
jgi:hypothetical protein